MISGSKMILAVLFAVILGGQLGECGEKKKLKVFLLAGQSNMVGHCAFHTVPSLIGDNSLEGKRAAKLVFKDPDTVSDADVDALLDTEDAFFAAKEKYEASQSNPAEEAVAKAAFLKAESAYKAAQKKLADAFKVSDRVYITSIADGNKRSGKLTFGYGGSPVKLGPELGFGLSIEQELDGPILIIKTSWGGKSLNYDFRPPSAGTYELVGDEKAFDSEEHKKTVGKAKAELAVWLAGAEKALKVFWAEHDQFMAKNLSKERYAEWRKVVADWDQVIEDNGGMSNLRPWMVWALENKAEAFFKGTKIKPPTMNFSKTYWEKRPDMADGKTGDEIRAGAGIYYNKMVQKIDSVLADLNKFHPDYDAEAGYEISGFVWFQGFNDQFKDGFHSNYKRNMIALINDIRERYKTPDMPVVIGVLGTAMTKEAVAKNPVSLAQRQAATDPAMKDTVTAVETYPFYVMEAFKMWDDGTWDKPEGRRKFSKMASDRPYHYMGSGRFFTKAGEAFGIAMNRLIMNKK
jgi:hypothetical protein